ncbi:MAG: ABC transporter permease [Dehalococcoidia bacterium]
MQRLVLSVPTVVGLTLLVFTLLHVAIRADTVDLLIAQYQSNDPTLAARLREEFGLNASLPQQYLRWAGNLLRGDLGTSLFTRRPVANELGYRLPTSIEVGWARTAADDHRGATDRRHFGGEA